jgi:hypothetical protein
LSAAPALGHPDSPSSPPLVSLSIRLKHQPATGIVALFAREERPDSPGERLPRAARSDSPESLLPGGIDAVLRGPTANQVIVVGTEAHPAELRECIRVVDVPVQRMGPDHGRVVLTLRRADAARVRQRVLHLPGAGSAAASDRQLVLEGTPEWLHRALRQVVRAELNEPESVGRPAP